MVLSLPLLGSSPGGSTFTNKLSIARPTTESTKLSIPGVHRSLGRLPGVSHVCIHFHSLKSCTRYYFRTLIIPPTYPFLILVSCSTPEISAHLVKVYNTLAATVGLAAVGGAGAVLLVPTATLGAVALFSSIAAFVGVLAISFTDRSRTSLRQNLLWGTGLLMGAGIAPLLSVVSPGTIVMALAGTAAIFAGFSVAALRAKSDTFLKFGGPLLGGLFLLVRTAARYLCLFDLVLTLPLPCLDWVVSVQLDRPRARLPSVSCRRQGAVQHQLMGRTCPVLCIYFV